MLKKHFVTQKHKFPYPKYIVCFNLYSFHSNLRLKYKNNTPQYEINYTFCIFGSDVTSLYSKSSFAPYHINTQHEL